ncbi:MAG: GNAT family N-acetyltransferase [Microscillaceae bacterium]|jgi:RimJ/RimL family protein N-acetyltransferase|nr:GNAT family N-acetyltransferase [Microscillaceae bacterium]
MKYSQTFATARLSLRPIQIADSAFMYQLLNSPDWLRFIGDRNIRSLADAQAYIQAIIDESLKNYWLVSLNPSQTAIGVISLIKRDYLEYVDLGFAFLSDYYGQGYAREATQVVVDFAWEEAQLAHIQAITNQDNYASIRLLQKLGFQFQKNLTLASGEVCLYAVSPPLA